MSFKQQIARQKLKPTETVPYTLKISLDGENQVVLFVKHAGESNRGYTTARRKLDSTFRTTQSSARLREVLTPLLAKYVVSGWEHVIDDSGKACPYSPEKFEELFASIIEEGGGDVFDALFAFSLDPNNFRGTVVGEATDLGNG